MSESNRSVEAIPPTPYQRLLESLRAASGVRPAILYHYTKQAAFRSIMEDKVIWASNALYLNDAAELNYGVSVVNEVLGERLNCASSERAAQWDDLIGTRSQTPVYVASFSALPHDLSQWRAYGGESPYCLGLDTEAVEHIAQFAGPVGFLLRCFYTQEEHRAIAVSLCDILESVLDTESKSSASQIFTDLLVLTASCIKHESFKAEDEWRLVYFELDESIEEAYRSGRSFLIPYYRVPIVVPGTTPHLARVLVGPTPHPDLAMRSAWNACMRYGWTVDKLEVTPTPYRHW